MSDCDCDGGDCDCGDCGDCCDCTDGCDCDDCCNCCCDCDDCCKCSVCDCDCSWDEYFTFENLFGCLSDSIDETELQRRREASPMAPAPTLVTSQPQATAQMKQKKNEKPEGAEDENDKIPISNNF